MKKFLLYLFRWQMSTPILFFVIYFLNTFPTIAQTIIANIIGGAIFFWVDKWIFSKKDW